MNKAELIAEAAKSLETKAQAKAAIDGMINNSEIILMPFTLPDWNLVCDQDRS